jgi:hypothetical protein
MEQNMIHFITRCTREKEGAINAYSSIMRVMTERRGEEIIEHPFEWIVVGPQARDLDHIADRCLECPCPEGDYACLLNTYLREIGDEGQWVYILDDDNLMHPDFIKVYTQVKPDSVIFVGSQLLNNGIRIAKPWKLSVQEVDSAQYAIKKSHIGNLKHWDCYRHDGYFLTELVIRAREQNKGVQVFEDIMSYYNAQQWKSDI